MVPLTVKLRADGSEFATGVQSAISGLQSRLVQFASAGALVGYLRSIKQMTDEIKDGSEQAGLSAEAFQELSFAFQQSGATAQDLVVAMRNMSKERQAAIDGDEKAIQKMARYGLTLAQVKAMNPDEMFMAIGREVARIEDPMTRSAAATDLFGKAGTKLIQGLKDIEALRQQARDEGMIIKNSDIELIDQASDKIDALIMKVKVLGAQGFLSFANKTEPVGNSIVSASAQVGGIYGGLLKTIMGEDSSPVDLQEQLDKRLREKETKNRLAMINELGKDGQFSPIPDWMQEKETATRPERIATTRREQIGLTNLQRIGAFAPGGAQRNVEQIANQQLEVQKQLLGWARKTFGSFGIKL